VFAPFPYRMGWKILYTFEETPFQRMGVPHTVYTTHVKKTVNQGLNLPAGDFHVGYLSQQGAFAQTLTQQHVLVNVCTDARESLAHHSERYTSGKTASGDPALTYFQRLQTDGGRAWRTQHVTQTVPGLGNQRS